LEFEFREIKTADEWLRQIRGVINKRDILFLHKTDDYYAVGIPVRNMVTNPTLRLFIVPIEIMVETHGEV
jgi:hypothetical protein